MKLPPLNPDPHPRPVTVRPPPTLKQPSKPPSYRVRRAAAILGLSLALIVAVLLINTLRRRPASASSVPMGTPPAVDSAAVAEHLAQAVRFKTVSHEEAREDDYGQLVAFRDFLERTYSKTHADLSREVINGYALLYTWKGRDPKLAPVLLAAHMDVVPVEPGTEAKWSHPPFDAVIADGLGSGSDG